MSDDIDMLYRRYIVMVRNCACRIVGDRAVAQDLAQDVFVKFMQRRDALGEEADAPSLLYRMATNAALNHLRDTQRRASKLESAAPPGRDENVDDKLTLRAVLASVPEEEATVATYYYVDGMLQEEIAALTHIERRTVSNRLDAFRRHARRILGLKEVHHVA